MQCSLSGSSLTLSHKYIYTNSCHARPSSVGITGAISLVDLQGPAVILSLQGQFWHRRETVLGRAAVWLHARMPEISTVAVADPEELRDFINVLDEWTGELAYQTDKRSPDFNGDRETMEYQGLDPDVRGPFPAGGLKPGRPLIDPA